MRAPAGKGLDLHGLAQALAAAALSVDAAEAFLDRGDLVRLRDCLHGAAEALARGGEWIDARRAEEAAADIATPAHSSRS